MIIRPDFIFYTKNSGCRLKFEIFYPQVVSATNCSSDSLIPTDEESDQDLGKVFSCTCGGGGDAWTDALCSLQPDTWVEFTVKGPGTDESPAVMTLTGGEEEREGGMFVFLEIIEM